MKELSDWLVAQAPDLKGFSASNLWRMKQLYEAFADYQKTRTAGASFVLVAQPLILGHSKSPEEREVLSEVGREVKMDQANMAAR